MAEAIISDKYQKRAIKFLKLYPTLVKKYKKTLLQLKFNPYHPSLRLHKLKGNFQEYYSVSINMQYRIMIDFIIQDDKVILIEIGNHDFFYR
jgi:mRNA-degrading endonuclease YafQ of YafQ-DinJ toxin-antitoxin module